MVNVNVRNGGREEGGLIVGKMGAMSSVVHGEMEKDFFPNFLQPFLENINLGSHNDGSRKLIPVFCDPHRKSRSPSCDGCYLEAPGKGVRSSLSGPADGKPCHSILSTKASPVNLL